jgi:hypothetical protein
MKRKLIIHVGMGKTGSSSIQKTLRVARPALEKQGIKYLGLMLEHLALPKDYTWQSVSGWREYIRVDPPQANRELAHALQYADDHLSKDIHTLIWSNESLFDRLEDVQPALEAVRHRYDVQVVGYVRRPDSWIMSAYLQWGIKHKTYRGPLKPFRAWTANLHWAVSSKVEVWRAIAEQARFYNFDAIEDVSAHFAREVLTLDEHTAPSLRENDTPPPPAMALFACHNSLDEGQVLPDELEPLLKRAGLYEKMQKSPPYNKLLPDEEEIAAYVERHRPEVERINAVFKESGEPLFDLSTQRSKDYSVTPWDSNRALLQLIVHLAEEVEQLKARLNEKGGDK